MAIWVAEGDNDINFNGNGANDGILVSRCFAVEGNVAMADADAAYVRAGSTIEYVRDRSSAIVTMPARTEFATGESHATSRWGVDLDLAISDGTDTVTDDFQVQALYSTRFGTAGAGPYVSPPGGSPSPLAAGDDVYVYTEDPDALTSVDPSRAHALATSAVDIEVMAFDVSLGSWMAILSTTSSVIYEDAYIDNAAVSMAADNVGIMGAAVQFDADLTDIAAASVVAVGDTVFAYESSIALADQLDALGAYNDSIDIADAYTNNAVVGAGIVLEPALTYTLTVTGFETFKQITGKRVIVVPAE